MCLFAVFCSRGIVVKYTVAILFRTVDSNRCIYDVSAVKLVKITNPFISSSHNSCRSVVYRFVFPKAC